jgi:hypothetical protein
MGVMHHIGRCPGLSVKGHEDQPPGVEAGKQRRDHQHSEGVSGGGIVRHERRFDDRILGEEPGSADHGPRNSHAGKRDRADDHHPIGRRDLFAQPAHAPHVLLVGNRVDDRTGAKKQQRFEESMREQVENRRAISTDAKRHEHVAELRTGRIGDNPFDVILHQTDRGREKRGDCTDRHHHCQRVLRKFEQRRHPRHQKHAGGHHRRRVDKRRHRRRAFHRVRQPGVQKELRRLAHRAHEQQQAHRGQRMCLVKMHPEQRDDRLTGFRTLGRDEVGRTREDRVERDRSEQGEHPEHTQQETEIPDPVDDKGFHRRGIGGRLLVPETDQQIGGDADTFPAEKHLQQIVRGHQHQHREGEQRQVGEEPRAVRIVMHVANRVEVHQRRHGVDHNQHDRGQSVDPERPVDAERTGIDPAHNRHPNHLGFAHGHGEKSHPRQQRRDNQEQCRHIFRRLGADGAAAEPRNKRADQRQKDDSLVHGSLSPSSC